jgi:hypothetical protein
MFGVFLCFVLSFFFFFFSHIFQKSSNMEERNSHISFANFPLNILQQVSADSECFSQESSRQGYSQQSFEKFPYNEEPKRSSVLGNNTSMNRNITPQAFPLNSNNLRQIPTQSQVGLSNTLLEPYVNDFFLFCHTQEV